MAETTPTISDEVSAIILLDIPYKNCIDYVAITQNQTTAYQLDKAVIVAAMGIENQEDCTVENLVPLTKAVIKEWGLEQVNGLS
jgi:hypothetical protein